MAADEPGESEDQAEESQQWAGDPLAQFLAAAWRNTVGAFSAERERYRALAEVDAVYRRLIENLGGSDENLAGALLVRSHGSILAAGSLALSGQIAEAYSLLRGALEAALQGLFVAGSPERQRIWISRNDNDVALDKMQAEFTSEAMLRRLQETDAATASIYEKLRDRAIDRASHPNRYARLTSRKTGAAQAIDFNREYFICNDDVQRSCLRTAVQVGICCLSIFYYVFGDLYRELALDARITKLRQGH